MLIGYNMKLYLKLKISRFEDLFTSKYFLILIYLTFLFSLSFLTSFIPLFQIKYLPGFDSPFYLIATRKVAEMGVFSLSPQEFPLFPSMAYLISRVFGLEIIDGVKWTVVLIFSFSPIFFYFLVKSISNERVAVLSSFLMLITPVRYRLISDLYNNSLALILFFVFLIFIHRFWVNHRLKDRLISLFFVFCFSWCIFISHPLVTIYVLLFLFTYLALFFFKRDVFSFGFLLVVICLIIAFSRPYSTKLLFGLPESEIDDSLYIRAILEDSYNFILGRSAVFGLSEPGMGKLDLSFGFWKQLIDNLVGESVMLFGILGALVGIFWLKEFMLMYVFLVPVLVLIPQFVFRILVFADRFLIMTAIPLIFFSAFIIDLLILWLSRKFFLAFGVRKELCVMIAVFIFLLLFAQDVKNVANKVRFGINYSISENDIEFLGNLSEFTKDGKFFLNDLNLYWFLALNYGADYDVYSYHYTKLISDEPWIVGKYNSSLFYNSETMAENSGVTDLEFLNRLNLLSRGKKLYLLFSFAEKGVDKERFNRLRLCFLLVRGTENFQLLEYKNDCKL